MLDEGNMGACHGGGGAPNIFNRASSELPYTMSVAPYG